MSTTDDSKPVDLSLPVQTRDGREVRIYTIAGESRECPVIGEQQQSNGCWSVASWHINGKFIMNSTTNSDLFNVPRQHTGQINFYRAADGTIMRCCLFHNDKATANKNSHGDRIACIEVTFTEGEGLE